MKKLFMYLAPVLASGVSLAQEQSTTVHQMFSEAANVTDAVTTELVPFLVGAFAITAAFVAYKLAKRGANKV